LAEGVVASTDVPGSSPRRTRGRHLIGPLLLLVAGVLLLLNNLQIVPWSIWREIWPFWPLLLVLLGLEALVTGRVAWGTLALLVLLLPILGFVVTASSFASRWHDETRGDVGRRTSTFHQGLDGASSATIQVEYGAGALDIGPLAGPPPANTLALGEVFGHGGTRFEAQSTLQNGRRILQVSPSHAGTMFDLGRLELRLTSAIPIDIEIESGASELTLNLETLRIPNLSIETGASQTRIVLPAQGETKVQIEGGAAGIEIVVPPNVAARIMVEEGPNRVQIDEQRFPRRGDEYRSPNFDTATDRATLRIDVGASRLVVQ
jgi:hypothetical protein